LQQPPQGTRVFWERALTNLRKAKDRVAQRYNAQRREVTFQVGNLVLIRRHPLSSKVLKRSAKLENRWSTPMVIVRFLTRVTVRLANPDTGVLLRKAHVSQLKKYFPAE
jgi:hypothetical protein